LFPKGSLYKPCAFLEFGTADVGRRVSLLPSAPDVGEACRGHGPGKASPLNGIWQRLLFEVNAHEFEDVPLRLPVDLQAPPAFGSSLRLGSAYGFRFGMALLVQLLCPGLRPRLIVAESPVSDGSL